MAWSAKLLRDPQTRYNKMYMSTLPRYISAAILVALFFITFGLGVYAGHVNRPETEFVTALFNKESGVSATVDFEPFWKAWNVINAKYVSGDGPTDQEKVWGAIEGLAGSLGDPYTVFFPPVEAERFASEVSGEFQGVGMEVGMRDDTLTIIAPLKGTPAFRAGIRSGDKILEIDGKITAGMTVDEAVGMIRGQKGTKVSLTIFSKDTDGPRTLEITRDVIAIPTIDTEIRAANGERLDLPEGSGDTSEVFVIKLYNFSAQSPELFRQALRSFIVSDKTRLVLDLRGNPGGYLEAAVDIASWFLPPGKVVVSEEFADKSETVVQRSRGYSIFTDKLKMAVIVDEGSASASEILAGALSEHKIATLVGTKTFGKGSVQELVPITDNTSLKITIARWLTPNGISISEGGLTPDIEIAITKEDIVAGRDPQLLKALDIVSK